MSRRDASATENVCFLAENGALIGDISANGFISSGLINGYSYTTESNATIFTNGQVTNCSKPTSGASSSVNINPVLYELEKNTIPLQEVTKITALVDGVSYSDDNDFFIGGFNARSRASINYFPGLADVTELVGDTYNNFDFKYK